MSASHPLTDYSVMDSHERIGLAFSGGKDSLAIAYLLRPYWDRVTFYHCDAGDLLPETVEVVSHVEALVPRFVRIKTDSRSWMERFGLASDLVPVSCTSFGRSMLNGKAGSTAIVDKYACCSANIWVPMHERLTADDVTLAIRGTRRADYGWGALESATGKFDGSTISAAGRELWFPIHDWETSEVFSFLRESGAPVARYYEHNGQGPECACCPAYLDEDRALYLKRHHPVLAERYAANLKRLSSEISKPFGQLQSELEALA